MTDKREGMNYYRQFPWIEPWDAMGRCNTDEACFPCLSEKCDRWVPSAVLDETDLLCPFCWSKERKGRVLLLTMFAKHVLETCWDTFDNPAVTGMRAEYV